MASRRAGLPTLQSDDGVDGVAAGENRLSLAVPVMGRLKQSTNWRPLSFGSARSARKRTMAMETFG